MTGFITKFLITSSLVLSALTPAAGATSPKFTARDLSPASGEKRTAEFVCELSLFFSVDPESRLERKDERKDSVKAGDALEGRGLLTCKNSQGFTTELPVLADLQAELPAAAVAPATTTTRGPASVVADPDAARAAKEISFSGNTSQFVIPREVNQIYDVYSPREFSWEKNQPASDPSFVFRGSRNDLVIKIKLASKTANITGLKVKGLKLSFDEQAPDIY